MKKSSKKHRQCEQLRPISHRYLHFFSLLKCFIGNLKNKPLSNDDDDDDEKHYRCTRLYRIFLSQVERLHTIVTTTPYNTIIYKYKYK